MIKLMIVDDENFVIRGLLASIDWKALKIDVVEQAEDGARALSKASEFQPDIVLSDIRMPGIDGIEFASHLHKILPDCKIVFMSAYTDKEYLKSAISLNAVGYVEKPISLAEMTSALQKAVNLHLQDETRKAGQQMLKRKMEETAQLAKNKLVLEMIKPRPCLEILNDSLASLNCEFYNDAEYMVAITRFVQHDTNNQEDAGKLANRIQITIDSFGFQSLTAFHKEGMLTTVLQNKSSRNSLFNSSDVLRLTNQLFYSLQQDFKAKYSLFLALGKPVQKSQDLHLAYETAVMALQALFYTGFDNYFIYQDPNEDAFVFEESLYEEFKTALTGQSRHNAIQLVSRLTSAAKSCRSALPNYLKDIYFNLLLLTVDAAKKRNIRLQEAQEQEFQWNTFAGFNTLDETEQYLLRKIELFFSAVEQGSSTHKTVTAIIRLISSEYGNPDLSIKSISQSLLLSDVHLCVVFKRETGKTINQYLTEYRIEKAKELLKEKHIKLYDVAKRVGYSNHDYFTRIFKKQTNLTPSEYRESVVI